MLSKLTRVFAVAVLALAAVVVVLLALNGPPSVPAMETANAATQASAGATRPTVVKLHARWCPVCMLTKQQWSEIEALYAGRVTLFVVDNTTPSSTRKSRAAAEALGLATLVDRYQGATGAVLVVDGQNQRVLSELFGKLPLEDYRAAIDAALRAPPAE